MEIKEKFGEILKSYREGSSLSQEELAHISQLDRTYISLLERGKRNPTLETLFKLAKALEILPSEIIKKLEEKK